LYLGESGNYAVVSTKPLWLTYQANTKRIVNAHNKCLDISGASTWRGTNLLWWGCHGGFNQEWGLPGFAAANKTVLKKVVKRAATPGVISIRPALHQKQTVSVYGEKMTVGNNYVLWQDVSRNHQRFALVRGKGKYANYFLLRTMSGNLYLNSDAHGKGVLSKSAVWLTYNTKTRQIYNTQRKACLDSSGGYFSNGTQLLWYRCHSGNNQKWIITGWAQAWAYGVRVVHRKQAAKVVRKVVAKKTKKLIKKVVKHIAKKPVMITGWKGLKSLNAKVSYYLTIRNTSTQWITIWWINYKGGLQMYKKLLPGQSWKTTTYVTHPWVFKNAKGVVFGYFSNKLPYKKGSQHTLTVAKNMRLFVGSTVTKKVVKRPSVSGVNYTGLKSIHSKISYFLTFTNTSVQYITIWWIGYKGELHKYFTLAPGKSWTVKTFVSHPWVLKNSKNVAFALFRNNRAVAMNSRHAVTITKTMGMMQWSNKISKPVIKTFVRGLVQIKYLYKNMVMDISKVQYKLWQTLWMWGPSNADNQRFALVAGSGKWAGWFLLRTLHGGLYVGDNKGWLQLTKTGVWMKYNSKTHSIMNSSKKCLDMQGGKTYNGVKLLWYTCKGSKNQQFAVQGLKAAVKRPVATIKHKAAVKKVAAKINKKVKVLVVKKKKDTAKLKKIIKVAKANRKIEKKTAHGKKPVTKKVIKKIIKKTGKVLPKKVGGKPKKIVGKKVLKKGVHPKKILNKVVKKIVKGKKITGTAKIVLKKATAKIATPPVVQILNSHNQKMVLDISGIRFQENIQIILYNNVKGINQKWMVIRGKNGQFMLQAMKNKLFLAGNQRWVKTAKKGVWMTYDAKTGTIHLASDKTKCLDISNGRISNGSWIQWWKCNNSKAQHWKLPGFAAAKKAAPKVTSKKAAKKVVKKAKGKVIKKIAKKVVKAAAKKAGKKLTKKQVAKKVAKIVKKVKPVVKKAVKVVKKKQIKVGKKIIKKIGAKKVVGKKIVGKKIVGKKIVGKKILKKVVKKVVKGKKITGTAKIVLKKAAKVVVKKGKGKVVKKPKGKVIKKIAKKVVKAAAKKAGKKITKKQIAKKVAKIVKKVKPVVKKAVKVVKKKVIKAGKKAAKKGGKKAAKKGGKKPLKAAKKCRYGSRTIKKIIRKVVKKGKKMIKKVKAKKGKKAAKKAKKQIKKAVKKAVKAAKKSQKKAAKKIIKKAVKKEKKAVKKVAKK